MLTVILYHQSGRITRGYEKHFESPPGQKSYGHERTRREGAFELQKFYLPVKSRRVAGKTAVRSDNAVAGDYKGYRVMSDRSPDRTRRRAAAAGYGHPVGYLTICRDGTVRYGHQYSVYLSAESRLPHIQRRRETGISAAEINIKPSYGIFKHGKIGSLPDISVKTTYSAVKDEKEG